jgi:hypothetical protein
MWYKNDVKIIDAKLRYIETTESFTELAILSMTIDDMASYKVGLNSLFSTTSPPDAGGRHQFGRHRLDGSQVKLRMRAMHRHPRTKRIADSRK